MEQWGIDGFLCGDCHLDKMKQFYSQDPSEKEKCEMCGRGLDPKDVYELHRGLNLKSKICAECYENERKELDKKSDNCTICGKKLGFFRYNPKREWNIGGQLCRQCWDHQNS
jgi:hypothetical protein